MSQDAGDSSAAALEASLARFRAVAMTTILARKMSRAAALPIPDPQPPVSDEPPPSNHVWEDFTRWFRPSTWFS